MPEKERLQPEGNKGVRVGQGYEGVGHRGQKFFSKTVNPLLHLELRPCNNSPFFIAMAQPSLSEPRMMTSVSSYMPRLLPLRLPRLCVAVIGSEPNELVEKAESLVRDNSFLEFRLDYLSKPGLAMPRIKRFFEAHPGTVVIATCRRVVNGGKFRGSIASQLDVLSKAAAAGCQLVEDRKST